MYVVFQYIYSQQISTLEPLMKHNSHKTNVCKWDKAVKFTITKLKICSMKWEQSNTHISLLNATHKKKHEYIWSIKSQNKYKIIV